MDARSRIGRCGACGAPIGTGMGCLLMGLLVGCLGVGVAEGRGGVFLRRWQGFSWRLGRGQAGRATGLVFVSASLGVFVRSFCVGVAVYHLKHNLKMPSSDIEMEALCDGRCSDIIVGNTAG